MGRADRRLAFILALSLIGITLMANQGVGADKVGFALAWLFSGENAHWLVAKEKGYFAEQGLDVEVLRGYGSADGVRRVMAKERDMALVAVSAAVLARAKGNPVKVVAIDFETEPLAIFSLKTSGIKTLKNLEGRSVAVNTGGIDAVLFPVLAKINGVDLAKVKVTNVTPGQGNPMLIAGKFDALASFIVQKPHLEADAQPLGGISIMLFADLGVDLYSNSVVATEDYIRDNPDTIRRFLRGWRKGLEYSRSRPDELIDILSKYEPGLTKAAHRARWDIAVKDIIFTPRAEKVGLGYVDSERMRVTRDLVLQAYEVKTPVKLEDIYTNEFLK